MEEKRRLRFYETYRELMADDVRLSAYRDAIEETVDDGDVVLDIGTGLGVLAFFALDAGADTVYAVEDSDVVHLAREIADHNGYDGVEFIHDRSSNVELDEDVDVIVTETFGSLGLDENVVPHVADARERLLASDGSIVPQTVSCHVAPTEAAHVRRKIDRWKRLEEEYGIDHEPVREAVLSNIIDDEIEPANLLADGETVFDVDLRTADHEPSFGEAEFTFERDGLFHGFAGWFTSQLSPSVEVTNAPDAPDTHWDQALLPVEFPVKVEADDSVTVRIGIGPKPGGETGDVVVDYNYACRPGSPDSDITTPPRPDEACYCGSGDPVEDCCPEILQ